MSKEDAKKAFKESFEELLSMPEEIISEESIDDIVEKKPEYPTRYQTLKGAAEKKAKKTLDSLLKFYSREKIIEQHEYVQAKAEMDKAALSTLIYQMQTTERAITTLLDNIDNDFMGTTGGQKIAKACQAVGLMRFGTPSIHRWLSIWLLLPVSPTHGWF